MVLSEKTITKTMGSSDKNYTDTDQSKTSTKEIQSTSEKNTSHNTLLSANNAETNEPENHCFGPKEGRAELMGRVVKETMNGDSNNDGAKDATNEAINDVCNESSRDDPEDEDEPHRKRPCISLEGTGAYDGKSTATSVKQNEKCTTDTSQKNDEKHANQLYSKMPYHGDHRRAVSSVAFAPTESLVSRGRFGDTSLNCAQGSGVVAMCASASADGSAKIWEITEDMMEISKSHRSLPSDGLDASNAPTTPEMGSNPQNLTNAQSESISAPSSTLLQPKLTLVGHYRGINDVAFSPTAAYLATASDDKTLRLWDVSRGSSGDALVEFRGHSNFVFSCKFNPQSNLLVSGSFDETVKLWDIRCGECVSTLPAHSDPVTGVDFNRDGTCIVSGSQDGLIRVWDTATGECLKTVYAEGNPPVGCVRFSPNGKYVLAGTLDSKLRLWNVAGRYGKTGESTSAFNYLNTRVTPTGGKCSKTYAGHENRRFCAFATFSSVNPLRQYVVSGSEDGKVYLYDLQRRLVKQTLAGHDDAVLAVDAHDSLELIASGGMTKDKTVRFWTTTNIPEDEIVSQVETEK